jgi:hypothetical protein
MSNLWITPEELGEYEETEFSYEAAKAASHLLWSLSGRKYSGTTTVTERYVCVNRMYRYGSSVRNTSPQIMQGEVYNIPTRDLDFFYDMTSDGSSPSRRVKLRGRPVTKIHVIRNRVGTTIDPSHYYLVDHSTIQATPGVAWVPCDIEVTYTYGIAPPTLGKMAARTLAMEFCKLWNGDDDCALPQRITSVNRQGVSYTILDTQDFVEEMRTGLYSVDLFLKSVNPDKARAKARVFSPDISRARRYTPKSPKLGTDGELDISVLVDSTGTAEPTLEYLNAEFLADGLGWEPYVIVRNYSDSNSMEIEEVPVLTTSDTKLLITVGYADTKKTLGLVDPGTYDLYARRIVSGEEETVYIASGNLSIALATSSVNAYVLGG